MSEQKYLNILQDIIDNGNKKYIYGHDDKYLLSLFGTSIRFDLNKGFPLLTTKKVFYRGIMEELLWFIKGDNNVKNLANKGVHIWDEWSYKKYKKSDMYKQDKLTQEQFIHELINNDSYNSFGILDGIYGQQWRKWKSSDGREIDQLKWALWKLKQPEQRERKHILVNAWNPEYIYEMSDGNSLELPPCHFSFQFNVSNNKLSCMVFQRSCDYFLGGSFNIASYAALTMIMAKLSGLELGELIMSFGDCHLYSDHLEQAKEQINRTPYKFPELLIKEHQDMDLDNLTIDDFELLNYNCHEKIKAEVTAVGGYDASLYNPQS